MAGRFYNNKPKSSSHAKDQYTTYLISNRPVSERPWTSASLPPDYLQFVSIDPGEKNLALRIERRYHDGRIVPLVFDKVCLTIDETGVNICSLFVSLRNYLDRYLNHYYESHYIIMEKQVVMNHEVILEIAQSIVMYFTIHLVNAPLMPEFIRIDPKVKLHQLHPDGSHHKMTKPVAKKWSAEMAKFLFIQRGDAFSLDVMNKNRTKADDLGDVTIQIEAFCKYMNFPLTNCENCIDKTALSAPQDSKINLPTTLPLFPTISSSAIAAVVSTTLPTQPRSSSMSNSGQDTMSSAGRNPRIVLPTEFKRSGGEMSETGPSWGNGSNIVITSLSAGPVSDGLAFGRPVGEIVDLAKLSEGPVGLSEGSAGPLPGKITLPRFFA